MTNQATRPFLNSLIIWATYENDIMTITHQNESVNQYHGSSLNWVTYPNKQTLTYEFEKALYKLWRYREHFEEYFND